MFVVKDLAPLVPELFAAAAAMALLMYGVFAKGNPARTVVWASMLVLVVALALVWQVPAGRHAVQRPCDDGFAAVMFAMTDRAAQVIGGKFGMRMMVRRRVAGLAFGFYYASPGLCIRSR